MDFLTLLLLGVFPVLMIVTGLHDLITMKIPNWISLALLAVFLPAALVCGLSLQAIGLHLAVGFGALLVGMALFALRWIGGGDAKALAAACLWLGVGGVGPFVLWTAVIGGLFCLLLISGRRNFPSVSTMARWPDWLVRLMEPKGDIPYGVAIAIGALLTFPQADLMARFTG
jgi:prepilin peptidase CpaA